MKKLIILIALLVLPLFAIADRITLNSDETLATPTAATISEWEITRINADGKVLSVRYRWRDSADVVINMGSGRSGWNYWSCRNTYQGDNNDCTDVDTPWDCCTGASAGICPEAVDTCFSDVFNFQIRQQDVDTSIGIGLRTLIWNKMKEDVLTGVNDGAFN